MTAPGACASGVELLAEYLEDQLPAGLRAEVEAHVSGCPRCVAFIESYRATPRILQKATLADLPADLGASLSAFLRARRR